MLYRCEAVSNCNEPNSYRGSSSRTKDKSFCATDGMAEAWKEPRLLGVKRFCLKAILLYMVQDKKLVVWIKLLDSEFFFLEGDFYLFCWCWFTLFGSTVFTSVHSVKRILNDLFSQTQPGSWALSWPFMMEMWCATRFCPDDPISFCTDPRGWVWRSRRKNHWEMSYGFHETVI